MSTNDTADTTENSSGYTNAEFVADAHADVRDEQERERAEAAEHAATKQWLEDQQCGHTRSITLRDREFDFRPINARKSSAMIAEAEDVDEASDRADELTVEYAEILGDHCVDPVMTGDVFLDTFEFSEIRDFIYELLAGGLDEDERERVDSFRDQ